MPYFTKYSVCMSRQASQPITKSKMTVTTLVKCIHAINVLQSTHLNIGETAWTGRRVHFPLHFISPLSLPTRRAILLLQNITHLRKNTQRYVHFSGGGDGKCTQNVHTYVCVCTAFACGVNIRITFKNTIMSKALESLGTDQHTR